MCNLHTNYIYDIYTLPIDYSAMVFEPRDAVFYDFEDEDLAIHFPHPTQPADADEFELEILET